MLNRLDLSTLDLQSVLLRIGLVSTAVLCWNNALTAWELYNVGIEQFSVIFLFLLNLIAFVMLALACLKTVPPKAAWIILIAALLVGASWAHRQLVYNAQDVRLTDVYMFSDYSAHLARMGENPYQYDLMDALRAYRMPGTFTTPLIDGDIGGQSPYPTLSFLLFVPFQALGIPTLTWVYGIFAALTFIVIFTASPPLLRPLVLLPLFIEPRYWAFGFSGVNDMVWVFLLCLLVVFWRKQGIAALCFGLACAFKQQAWLVTPFILIRIWCETENLPIRSRLFSLFRFSALTGLVFFVLNVPYAVWDFHAWLRGVLQPFLDNMVVFGQGISHLTMVGDIVIPRSTYTWYVLLAFSLSLFIYWRHFAAIRNFIWAAPGIVLWFGNRSLASYWYFFLIPFLLSVARDFLSPEPATQPQRSWKPSMVLTAATALLISGSIASIALTPNPISVRVMRPIETVGEATRRMRIEVINHSDKVLHPRVMVKVAFYQPFFWNIESGPSTLQPGETGYYVASTNDTERYLTIGWGGRVIISDSSDYGLRGSVRLDPEPFFRRYDNLPAASFSYWAGGAPFQWAFHTQPEENNGVLEMVDDDQFGSVPKFTLLEGSSPVYHLAVLDTWATFFEIPLQFWVKPPAEANNPDNFDLVYGFQLIATFSGQRVWVLFGDENRTGSIETGLPYVMFQAPRETWSLQTIDPVAIFNQLGIQIPPAYNLHTRYDQLTFPKRMMNFQFMLGARNQSPGPVSAVFGPIVNPHQFPDAERIIAQTVADPSTVDIMRGDYNRSVMNDESAVEYYHKALDIDPRSAQAYFGLGELSLRAEQWEDAGAQFEQALALGYVRTAVATSGMAWAKYHLGDEETTEFIELAMEQANARPYYYDEAEVATLFRRAGWIYLDDGKFLSAQQAFNQSVGYDAYSSESYFGLGVTFLHMDNVDLAVLNIHHAANLGFNDLEARLTQALASTNHCADLETFVGEMDITDSDQLREQCITLVDAAQSSG